MHLNFIVIISFCMQFYCTTCLYSSSRGYCPLPRILNGRAILRQRGRLVRFQCNLDFSLIGNQYAGCTNSAWDSPIPICVKRGCPHLERENGKVFFFEGGATANLFCDPGYEEAGARIAYCDGKDWDRSVGNCRETGVGPATWCDFDNAKICGWTTDPTHDFDWKQQNGGSKTGIMRTYRTGPKHDHTSMKPLEGFYMVAESFGRQGNEMARLLSPLYPAEKSVEACFRFYYYMYGRQLGRLRVYVKPISIEIEEVLSDSRHILFERSGQSENLWKEEIVSLNQHLEEFQIVLEASAGYSIYSDIAIDDVALLNGADCLNEQQMTTVKQEEELGGVYDMQSCSNRCNETKSESSIDDETIESGMGHGGILIHCDCYDGCEDKLSCCADYRRICVFDKPTDPTTYEPVIITDVSVTVPHIITTTKLSTTTSSLKPTLSTTKATTPTTTTKATTTSTTITTTRAPPITTKTSRKTTTTAKPTTTTTITTTTRNATKPPTVLPTKTTTLNTTTEKQKIINSSTVKPMSVTTPKNNANTYNNGEWRAPINETNDKASVQIWPILLSLLAVMTVAISIAIAWQHRNSKFGLGGSGSTKTDDVRYLIKEDNVDL